MNVQIENRINYGKPWSNLYIANRNHIAELYSQVINYGEKLIL